MSTRSTVVGLLLIAGAAALARDASPVPLRVQYPTEESFLEAFANIDVERRIRPDHPRLFLNEDLLVAIRKDPSKAALIAFFKKRIDEEVETRGFARTTPQIYLSKHEGIINQLRALSIPDQRQVEPTRLAVMAAAVYLYTGEAGYADLTTWLLETALLTYERRARRRLTIHWDGYSRLYWLTAYDWIYRGLPELARANLLRRYVQAMEFYIVGGDFAKGAYWEAGTKERQPAGTMRPVTTGAYSPRLLMFYIPLVALDKSFIDEELKESTLRPWLEQRYLHQLRLVYYRATIRGRYGGCSSSTISYAVGHYPESLIDFYYVARSALDLDFARLTPETLTFPYYIMWNMIYGENDRVYEFGAGHATRAANRFPGKSLNVHMNNLLTLYAHADANQLSVTRHVADAFANGTMPEFYRFLHAPRRLDIPRLDPAMLPRAFYFPNMGQVFSRSGNGPSDTYAMFQAGGTAMAHRQYDNLHFTIYKHGFQALDTGNRSPHADVTHFVDYQYQTVSNNALLIHMPGEKFPVGGRYSAAGYKGTRENYGGQDDVEGSEIVSFMSNAHFTYAAADATASYSSRKASLVTRQFIHFYPDLFVLFDRITSTRAAYRKDWVLHMAERPILLAGQAFRAGNGEGRIAGRTLLPIDARARVVEGFRWDEGREFPLGASAWRRFDDEARRAQGRWRIDVSPARGATTDTFLHLLEVGGPDLESLPPHSLTQTDGQTELRFEYGGKTVTVTLRATGTTGGHVTIADPNGNCLTDYPLTNTIADQEPFVTK